MKARLFVASLIVTVLIITVSMILTAYVQYNAVIDSAKNALKVYTGFYDTALIPNDENASETSEKLGGARVTLIGLNGEVLGDSSFPEITENHLNREEITAALNNGEGYAVRSSSTAGQNTVYYCKKISVPSGEILIRVSVDAPSVGKLIAQSLPAAAWATAADILICLLFTFICAKIILNPLNKLASDFSKTEECSTKYPEFKPLAAAVNRKNKEIARQVALIEEENRLVKEARDSKDDFISNITHEMNTPLTGISGFAELLSTGELSEEMRKKAVSNIIIQSERLSNLIRCIINYNEINSDELPSYEVNVSEIAAETIENLKPSIDEKGLRVETDIEENVVVLSRHERISEILGNLIRNATKYNKPDGKICLSVKGGNKPYMQVADTGIGIAEENLDKIFSRFFTVDKSHSGKNGGFGLGLAVVKKLCKKAGWKLTVKSVEGEGTTFRIEF